MSMALQDKGRQMTITANNNSVIYFELEQKTQSTFFCQNGLSVRQVEAICKAT